MPARRIRAARSAPKTEANERPHPAHGRRRRVRSADRSGQEIGGRETFEKLVRAFYAGVATDEVLLPMYPSSPNSRARFND